MLEEFNMYCRVLSQGLEDGGDPFFLAVFLCSFRRDHLESRVRTHPVELAPNTVMPGAHYQLQNGVGLLPPKLADASSGAPKALQNFGRQHSKEDEPKRASS